MRFVDRTAQARGTQLRPPQTISVTRRNVAAVVIAQAAPEGKGLSFISLHLTYPCTFPPALTRCWSFQCSRVSDARSFALDAKISSGRSRPCRHLSRRSIDVRPRYARDMRARSVKSTFPRSGGRFAVVQQRCAQLHTSPFHILCASPTRNTGTSIGNRIVAQSVS